MSRRWATVARRVVRAEGGMELGEWLALGFLLLSLCAAYALSFDSFLRRWGR